MGTSPTSSSTGRETDDVVELGWAIEPGPELTLDRPLSCGLGGTRFRLVAGGGTDPTPAGH